MSHPLDRPYMSRPSPLARLSHCYERNIAFGIQYRGDDDTLPCLIYYGAPFELLRDVMAFVGRCMSDKLKGYTINSEHSCRYRNGKAYHRLSVEIHGLQDQCVSLSDLALLIQSYMQRICWCKVKELPLKKLLNL